MNFARLTPVFLPKKRPSFARLFTKMSPSEEVVTLCLVEDKPIEKDQTMTELGSMPSAVDEEEHQDADEN